MDSRTYTHRDLARELGVSETTIKSYRSKFPTFLPVAREGKPVRLHPEALAVCRRIRALFDAGLPILQVQKMLQTEFKEYPLNRRLPIVYLKRTAGAGESADIPSSADVDEALAARIESLAKGQEEARERMEQLEAEVRNLSTMEAASKAMMAELVAELRAARDSALAAAAAVQRDPGPVVPSREEPERPGAASPDKGEVPPERAPERTVVTARKIVTVHGAAGQAASYAFSREPHPAPPFPELRTPAAAFLALPAVIRSDRGDFLGLPGGQSVRRLIEVFAPKDAARTDGVTWFAEGPDAWTCFIPMGSAQKREILFERTTTPRGNLVGLIRRMRINEAEATPRQLQEIFRQLRDQLT